MAYVSTLSRRSFVAGAAATAGVAATALVPAAARADEAAAQDAVPPQWVAAVSYTHLDVYKRQGLAPIAPCLLWPLLRRGFLSGGWSAWREEAARLVRRFPATSSKARRPGVGGGSLGSLRRAGWWV